MSMVVRTNTMALNANNALNKNNSTVAGNLEKLSTGFKINRAADDASGLAISEKMKAQIKALDTASKNAQDGASLIKTAEGYMGEVHDMLNRIVELAEKSANGTFETVEGGAKAETFGTAGVDRQALQDEVNQLTAEIDRIAETANFNELKLMNGDLKKTYTDADVTGLKTVKSANVKDDNLVAAGEDGKATAAGTGYTATGEAVTIKVGDDVRTTKLYTNSIFGDATAAEANSGSQLFSAAGVKSNKEGSSGGLTLQIGETSGASDKLTINVKNFNTASLFKSIEQDVAVGDGNMALLQTNTQSKTNGMTINISNQEVASKAAEAVRQTINEVSAQRASLGALENRLDYTMNNLNTASENITDANSRIRDTDMAKTMMQYTQGNTLTQAAQAMLAQANQAPSSVLQLLQ